MRNGEAGQAPCAPRSMPPSRSGADYFSTEIPIADQVALMLNFSSSFFPLLSLYAILITGPGDGQRRAAAIVDDARRRAGRGR